MRHAGGDAYKAVGTQVRCSGDGVLGMFGSYQVLLEAQAVVLSHSCPLKSPEEPGTHPWRF